LAVVEVALAQMDFQAALEVVVVLMRLLLAVRERQAKATKAAQEME
jgi:hypothetical protein